MLGAILDFTASHSRLVVRLPAREATPLGAAGPQP
jgi:hypothetical protein